MKEKIEVLKICMKEVMEDLTDKEIELLALFTYAYSRIGDVPSRDMAMVMIAHCSEELIEFLGNGKIPEWFEHKTILN